jgi:predicted O-methyltransferase YrrM
VIDLGSVSGLYARYADDLRSARARAASLYGRWMRPGRRSAMDNRLQDLIPEPLLAPLARLYWRTRTTRAERPPQLNPSFDDIDAEITYLLIRSRTPQTIVEVSPCGGWSTSWILSAVRDNRSGHVYSFDVIDDSRRILSPELTADRWTFRQGDVRRTVAEVRNPIDLLFIDADHSRAFAEWYIRTLFPRLSPSAVVCVDDIYLMRRGAPFRYAEAMVVLDWLDHHPEIRPFTASPLADRAAFDHLVGTRGRLGMIDQIKIPHRTDLPLNPAIFFEAPQSGLDKGTRISSTEARI